MYRIARLYFFVNKNLTAIKSEITLKIIQGDKIAKEEKLQNNDVNCG